MIRLWQDPDDDMYICTHGEIEQLPKDEDFYQCATTPWCEYAAEALSYGPWEVTLNYVRELECEVRACEYQIRGYIKKRADYSWSTDANDQYYHTIKTRKALAKCMAMWAERLLLIENYMPMAKLMES